MDIRTNKREYLQTQTSAISWSEVYQYLSKLDKKLESAQRELSYYDLYKFTEVVSKETELHTKMINLYPNTALIINADQKMTLDGESYKRGDVVVKLDTGSIVHIPSEAGGFWAPVKLSKNEENPEAKANNVNTYTLKYAWFTSAPQANSEGILDITADELKSPAKTVKLNYEITGQDVIYAGTYEKTGESFTFPLKTYNDQKIMPVAKCYSSENEEIICDLEYSITQDNKITYTWPADIVSKMVIK